MRQQKFHLIAPNDFYNGLYESEFSGSDDNKVVKIDDTVDKIKLSLCQSKWETSEHYWATQKLPTVFKRSHLQRELSKFYRKESG